METFSAWLAIHRSRVNSPHKGQWCRDLMFSLICAWINGWIINGEAGDLRRHRAHYVNVMWRSSGAPSYMVTVYCTAIIRTSVPIFVIVILATWGIRHSAIDMYIIWCSSYHLCRGSKCQTRHHWTWSTDNARLIYDRKTLKLFALSISANPLLAISCLEYMRT